MRTFWGCRFWALKRLLTARGSTRAREDSLNQAPTEDSRRCDSEHLLVESGNDVLAARGADLSLTSNLDPARPPRLDRGKVVNHKCDMRVLLHVAELLAAREIVAADVDGVLLGVVSKADRHNMRPTVDSRGQAAQAL